MVVSGLEVVFLAADPPRLGRFGLWDTDPKAMPDSTETIDLVLPAGRSVRHRRVPARTLTVAEALTALVDLDETQASDTARAWSAALNAALGLLARGRLAPGMTAAGWDAWRLGPLDPADAVYLQSLAGAFPPLAHALPVADTRPLAIASPEALIRACWDAVADTLVRTAAAPVVMAALAGGSGGRVGTKPGPAEATTGLLTAAEPVAVGALADWLGECAAGTDAGGRLGLRLELPVDADDEARAVLQVRSRAEPSLVVDAAEFWRAPAAVLARFGARAEADLLRSLRQAAQAWPPLEPALRQRAPWGVELGDSDVTDLLGPAAEALSAAGVELLWPAELMESGLSLRAVASPTPSPAPVAGAGLDLAALVEYRWELAIGDEVLTAEEVDALAEAKRPFVRLRGRWVAADPALLEKARRRQAARRLSTAQVLAGALGGMVELDGERVELAVEGPLADLAGRLRRLAGADGPGPEPAPAPEGLTGTLRPYQARGLAWLEEMCATGLGGCLADDMGLGKTIQVIALHLARRATGAGPTLVVCPTSLLGSWERELGRFAPDVTVRRFHGTERHLEEVAPDEVVLVTYGVVRRDRPALAEVGWGLVVADEAQHVKNPLARTARELRAIPAAARVALTGTPVENRLSDLWAILDWTTPGLLGPLEQFRTRVAVPVERYRDPEATEALARMTRPFLLRRRKSDPGIAPELPAKTETDRLVPLTREQATLYEAVVREAMERIRSEEGIARRGLVLALLTGLKQICNHPAQYLHQPGPIPGRSGKLAALDELVDIVTGAGDSVLVFSQYVEMGRIIEAHLHTRGIATRFLHGSVPARRREAMVEEFQAGLAPVFLLSLKAGGTGLNLTRATHVIHFDRWWNPAVEDQATDRAYRIGQDRPVQVHRLVTEGTVEDRVATLLSAKRALAEAVVGSGEGWLSEMSNDDLDELVSLGAAK
ncbi:MAG TPA: DEAD/DEAH box helicase [Acidimicrobiales bacterium]|nr:DEAD/DEAH box helicase [Acidimicrobiales bacterium]